MRKYLYILCFISLVWSSCREENIKVLHHQYFDLAAFFKQEAEHLSENKMETEKQITKDGSNEKKMFNNIDWQKELKPFIDCDINKAAWINSYQSDTTRLNAKEMRIVYKSLEQDIPVKSIELMLTDNKVEQVSIHRERHNFYYRSDDLYVYHSMKGYEINGSQNVRLLDKTDYHIIASFIPSSL